jgi:hypothetical protein
MATEHTQTYTYGDIDCLLMETITGRISLNVYDGDSVTIELRNDLRQPDILTPKIEQKNGELTIREIIPVNNPEGKTFWTLHVPRKARFQKVDCLSALGNISISGIKVEKVKAHSATRGIAVDKIACDDLELSTSSGKISVEGTSVASSAKCVTSGGTVDLNLARLPESRLEAASSTGRVRIGIPTFGDDFMMEIFKNADAGKIIMPFDCTSKETRKFHEDDSFKADKCTVKHGQGGPTIKLLTGTGTIEIATDHEAGDR